MREKGWAFLDDRRLSWKAKGLLAYMLTNGEQCSREQMNTSSFDGVFSTSTGLAELENFGYAKCEWEDGTRGRYGKKIWMVDTEGIAEAERKARRRGGRNCQY